MSANPADVLSLKVETPPAVPPPFKSGDALVIDVGFQAHPFLTAIFYVVKNPSGQMVMAGIVNPIAANATGAQIKEVCGDPQSVASWPTGTYEVHVYNWRGVESTATFSYQA